MALVALPIGAGVAVMSEYVVQLLLGDQWLDAIPLISVLAIFGTLGALQSNTTYVFLALGKPRIETYLGVAYVIILLSLLAVFIPTYKTFGVALAYLTTVVFMMPPTLLLIKAELGLKWGMIAGAFWRPLVATTGMYFGVAVWLDYLKIDWPDAGMLLELISGITLGAGLYVGLMLIMWLLVGKPERSAEKTVIHFLKRRLSRPAPDVR
jgi:O-antigen/teichoic acid export membrane protein